MPASVRMLLTESYRFLCPWVPVQTCISVLCDGGGSTKHFSCRHGRGSYHKGTHQGNHRAVSSAGCSLTEPSVFWKRKLAVYSSDLSFRRHLENAWGDSSTLRITAKSIWCDDKEIDFCEDLDFYRTWVFHRGSLLSVLSLYQCFFNAIREWELRRDFILWLSQSKMYKTLEDWYPLS